MDIKVAAGMFIVRNDDKILIGHPTNHKKDFWSIPKGLVEPDEDLLVAAKRETYEETNILLYCGLNEAWATIAQDIRTASFGAHHGMVVLGLVGAFKAFSHLHKGTK